MPKNILAIGTSGLGKTTFCRLLCDANVNGLGGPKSATQEIDIREGNGFCYIDTPGFDDSHGKTDEETFRKILSKFQTLSNNHQYQLDAVLWFCGPSERALEQYQKQAKFIQRFIEYTNDRPEDLWKSVLIVVKVDFSSKATGPKDAAKKICKKFAEERNILFDSGHFEVKDFPCWICDLDRSCEKSKKLDEMDLNTRMTFDAFRKQEIMPKIDPLISSLRPIQIRFTEKKCRKCGEEGDPRLFGIRCHTEIEIDKRHQVKSEHYHYREFGYYHCDTSLLCHEPDLSGYQKILSNVAQTSEMIKVLCSSGVSGGIAISKEIGKGIGTSTATVSTAAVSSAATTSTPTLITAATATKLAFAVAAASIAGTAVIVAGSYLIHVKLSEVKCKNCNKTLDTEGCVKKCENCKELLSTRGCELGYPCCKKQTKEAIGCQLREKCINIKCNKEEGCTEFCRSCGKPKENPGCELPANHDPIDIVG